MNILEYFFYFLEIGFAFWASKYFPIKKSFPTIFLSNFYVSLQSCLSLFMAYWLLPFPLPPGFMNIWVIIYDFIWPSKIQERLILANLLYIFLFLLAKIIIFQRNFFNFFIYLYILISLVKVIADSQWWMLQKPFEWLVDSRLLCISQNFHKRQSLLVSLRNFFFQSWKTSDTTCWR